MRFLLHRKGSLQKNSSATFAGASKAPTGKRNL